MRVCIIDGTFLYHYARSLGKSVEYKALLDTLKEDFFIDRVYIHHSVKEGVISPIVRLHDFLATNGYHSLLHPVQEFHGEYNFDLTDHMIVNLVAVSEFAKEILVVSENRQLHLLLQYLAGRGIIMNQLAAVATGAAKRVFDTIFLLEEHSEAFLVEREEPQTAQIT